MHLRRSAAALAATALLCAATAPAAFADESPSPQGKLPSALYGKGDPQYDGVWRQSLALLAQDAAGVTPAKRAVTWLADQQCDDGSFAAYRADSAEPCQAETPADTNATAVAVQALAALGGHGKAVESSVSWLKGVQNEDGGWSYNPGGDSDANSTAVVIGALSAAGEKPAETLSIKGDKSPYDAMGLLQLGCDAKDDDRGAFAYQPEKDGELAVNDAASAAATLAALGKGLAVDPAEDDTPVRMPKCGDVDRFGQRDSAQAAAAYLDGELDRNGGHLMSALEGAEDQPDHGNTALAALALAAGGHHDAAQRPLGWLEKNLDGWDKSADDPAALGQLVLAARAGGADPTAFGGVDLVKRLNATGPKPEAVPDSAAEDKADDGDGDGGSTATWWLVGAGLAAGAGIGILLSARGRNSKRKRDR